MSNIVIKNGILIAYYNNYSIYQMYTFDADEYYMCIANMDANEFQMVIDFKEEYFNSLLKNEQLTEIKNNCDLLFDGINPYIYILPNLTIFEYNDAKNDNDDRTYQLLLRKIQKYTYDTFKVITENNDIKINQVINIIVQTDDDKKFVNWLDMNLTNYFSYIDLKNIKKDNISHDDTDNNMIANETSNDLGNNINSNNKHKVRTLKSNNKKGFTSIYFITLVIVGAIVLGIAIANIMIR